MHDGAHPKAATKPKDSKALQRLRLFDRQRGVDRAVSKRRSDAQGKRRKTRGGGKRAKAWLPARLGSCYYDAWRETTARARRHGRGRGGRSDTDANDGAARAAAPMWRPLGPIVIPHGQTYGGDRPSVSGRVSCVAVDPDDGDHLLVGAGGGGVWESTDRGRTWAPRTDDQPTLATGAIAFAPSDSSVVYAGTGEGDALWRLGAGLLRSDDGGTSWSVLAADTFAGTGFYDIVVDHRDSQHLLVGVRGEDGGGGLHESQDGGTSWVRRRNRLTWDLSQHPSAPHARDREDEVFAGCSDGVRRSTDGGRTWRAVTLPSWPSQPRRIEVCHAPSDGDVVYVYVAYKVGASWRARLWRRNAFGGGFATVPLPRSHKATQGWYDWHASVSPANPDIVYVGAIELHRGERRADGRWDWRNLSAKPGGSSIHPDQHAMAFDPVDPTGIYAANDGGIYHSTDDGETWTSLNRGLGITEFEYIADHPVHAAWLLGGTQDNGTQRYEGQEVWYHVADGDGGDCGASDHRPETCFHTYYGMGFERSRSGGSWGSWEDYVDLPTEAEFYPPFEVRGRVVVQGGEHVYLSRDEGSTFDSVALPALSGQSHGATALAIVGEDTVFVGSWFGDVIRIDWDGASGAWGAATLLGFGRDGYVSDIAVDPDDATRIWITYSNAVGSHVFLSEDGGSAWDDRSTGLPTDIPVNAIAIDPRATATIFVGTDVGVFRTEDAGASWARFGGGLPNALVHDLLLHEPSRLLRAATQSRGVWEIHVDTRQAPVEVYVRDSAVDTGREVPSPSDVVNPFDTGSRTYWWECQDLKVDAPPFLTADAADLGYEAFADDHGVAASGLFDERPARGRTARVFVQLRNRGPRPADDVTVRLYATPASIGLPDLPADFWDGFPDHEVATADWQSLGGPRVASGVTTDAPTLVMIDWDVPQAMGDHVSVLVLVTCADDPLDTTETHVETLVRAERQAGLKSFAIVNPSPGVAPLARAVRIAARSDATGDHCLRTDASPRSFFRAFVFGKALARAAERHGLLKLRLTADEREALDGLLSREPGLARALDTTCAFAPPSSNVLVGRARFIAGRPQPLVAFPKLTNRESRRALLLSCLAEDRVVGGFTLARRGRARR